MAPLPTTALEVLIHAANIAPDKGITMIPQGRPDSNPERITYGQLLQHASVLSTLIQKIPGVKRDTIILLHLDSHKDNILWLWATVLSGLVPAISTPFTNDLEQRKKHLLHLKNVLHDPIVVTKDRLISEFAVIDNAFSIFTVESLTAKLQNSNVTSLAATLNCPRPSKDSLFALMLTSGSTGHAKAVTLRHGQVASALAGKVAYHGTSWEDNFFNWIGMDHVANLTEVHLHAMYLGAEQVHAHAGDLITQPLLFLRLLERHCVSYTFAPNFFLSSVKKALEAREIETAGANGKVNGSGQPDLSSLRLLISGGEANSTTLAASLTRALVRLGAHKHCIRPGFGMTETCAGSIYNTECPTFDVQHGREFTSLGHCIPCMKMRVTRPGFLGASVPVKPGETGNLEVKGANVFSEYFNNREATESSFTRDGWFVTGDLACIDEQGHLHLVGREKETININGIKYYPHEIEGAIEDASIAGVTPSFVAVFPHRPENADSETVCVVYLPSYQKHEDTARLKARSAIRDVVMKHCMTRPYKIIPLDKVFLPKTALGKLSRSKIKKAFESGVYDKSIAFDEERISQVSTNDLVQPRTPMQMALRDIFADVFVISPAEIGINTNIYDLGCSSLEINKLKWRLQSTPYFPDMIPLTQLISNPTIDALSASFGPDNASGSTVSKPYDPVVVLRSEGSKTPLWLVHPGMGEVLIFLHLARHIVDRPIYALRARGFDGEPFFASIDEMTSTYVDALRRVQPHGPYAIAGYSYGGTVAFEMAKKLRAEAAQADLAGKGSGESVPFLAVFDQPPHIKHRMRQGDWVDVLLTLARFFDLLPSPDAEDKVAARLNGVATRRGVSGLGSDAVQGTEKIDKDELVDILLAEASAERLEDFGLDKQRLATWTSLAQNSHIIARDYEPAGRVPALEVFYAEPIAAVAGSIEEWRDQRLSCWTGFVDDVKFHRVDGHHYTLMAPEHVGSFARVLLSRLDARGL